MSNALIHIEPSTTDIRVKVVRHPAYVSSGGDEYPARVTAHVDIDDVALTMRPEQLALLRDAAGAALDAHHRS